MIENKVVWNTAVSNQKVRKVDVITNKDGDDEEQAIITIVLYKTKKPVISVSGNFDGPARGLVIKEFIKSYSQMKTSMLREAERVAKLKTEKVVEPKSTKE